MPQELPLQNTTPDFEFLGLRGAMMDPLLDAELEMKRKFDPTETRSLLFGGDERQPEGAVQNLRSELDRVRAERDRLAAQQAEIMRLLNVSNPDKLLHDIRNLLNERELFKALTESLED